MTRTLRLGINVDHVATIRNARGGPHPCPVRAAALVHAAGGDGITAHLREDRRHIVDRDIERLRAEIDLPLNFEMAASAEMVAIARRVRPHACCLVPEKREERTTESGLDVAGHLETIGRATQSLGDAGIRVSLFVDADPRQLEAAQRVGAPVVELHTGTYAEVPAGERQRELERLQEAARMCVELGIECHAGHGLTYDNVTPVAAIATVAELNIGHFLVGEAVFIGFGPAIRRMRELMDAARAGA
jgi:pyridoxine 5-phosphate synthase